MRRPTLMALTMVPGETTTQTLVHTSLCQLVRESAAASVQNES